MRFVNVIRVCVGLLVVSNVFAEDAKADIVVIANPSSPISNIDQEELSRVFLGKTKSIGGQSVVPLDQSEGSKSREEFNKKVLNKSEAQVKSYWSRLIFTGKGTPPAKIEGDEAVKAQVAADPKSIGYVDEKSVDKTVKVVGKPE